MSDPIPKASRHTLSESARPWNPNRRGLGHGKKRPTARRPRLIGTEVGGQVVVQREEAGPLEGLARLSALIIDLTKVSEKMILYLMLCNCMSCMYAFT